MLTVKNLSKQEIDSEEKEMKKFENPTIEIMSFDCMDIITVSSGGVNNETIPGGGNIGICSINDATIWSDN